MKTRKHTTHAREKVVGRIRSTGEVAVLHPTNLVVIEVLSAGFSQSM